MRHYAFRITTDSSGDWTQTIHAGNGTFYAYRYVVDGTSPLATGADLDITCANSGLVYANQDNIGTSSFTKYPRVATHDEAGAASLYAAVGEPVETLNPVAGPITATIANGGASKVGVLHVWIG